MSRDYLNDVRVSIGTFVGEAPPETIAHWQSILNVPIQVHFDAASGVTTYLVNDFPEGVSSFQFALSLAEQGISEAKSVHLFDGERIRTGWDGFQVVGPEVSVIAPVLG